MPIIAALFFTSAVFAQQAALTGSGYLKLSKPKRVDVVKQYRESVRKEGVTVKKDAIFYCRSLDSFYAKHPDMQNESLAKVIKTLAIMEYDWDQKGVDKDALAKQWLGDDLYKANKARFVKK